MDSLVRETLDLLEFLKTQGEDWEQIYSKKAKKKVEEKTRDFLDGKQTDYKAEIRREVLKRLWASMSTEEKIEMVSEAASMLSQGVGLFPKAGLEMPSLSLGTPSLGTSSRSSKKPKKEKRRDKSESSESGGPSIGWLNELTMEDLQTLYEAYKVKRDVERKIEEFKNTVVEEAGEVGGTVGGQVGKLRAEVEFINKCEEKRQEFIVARKRYELLNEAIRSNKDLSRYEAELDALHYSLFSFLGPAMVYILGELNEKGRREYPEMCAEAQQYLDESRIGRGLRTKGEGLLRGIKSLGGLLGPSKEEQTEEATEARTQVASTLVEVANKSWKKHTGSIFVWTPDGVGKIQKALRKGKTPGDKLDRAHTVAETSASKKSKNRDPLTQIFYDAVADLDQEDAANMRRTKSILEEVGSQLG